MLKQVLNSKHYLILMAGICLTQTVHAADRDNTPTLEVNGPSQRQNQAPTLNNVYGRTLGALLSDMASSDTSSTEDLTDLDMSNVASFSLSNGITSSPQFYFESDEESEDSMVF